MTLKYSPQQTQESIHALFVDDKADWADLEATQIENHATEIDVTVAVGANEALVELREQDQIDCVLSDYVMPFTDGLELLERVRAEYSDIPYILMTSEGSEDIASEAMDADVTDYIVKEPSDDQTRLFVNKIRRAVERHRLRQTIEESEKRYRTVTEQSRDALGVFDRERVVFCNQRLTEITGRSEDELYEHDFVDLAIHPDDRDRVRSVIENWYSDEVTTELQETRIQQPDGTIRYCEYTGRWITRDGDRATLVSIRDVTERKRRERELQWERELNRTIQQALVNSRTREELEREVVEQLQRHGYALAWIGVRKDKQLQPRVVGEERQYIDEIDRSLDAAGSGSEPSVWAAQSEEPQFNQDFTDLFASPWRDAAESAGYRSGAAIPLTNNDVSYGILAVYHAQADRFDETERRLLTELADTVAFAIHSLETENALAADQHVTATVQVTDDDYYLQDLMTNSQMGLDEMRVEGTVPHDETQIVQFLTVYGCNNSVHKMIAGHPKVDAVYVINASEPVKLQVTASGPVPEVQLASSGVQVHSTIVDSSGASIEIELQSRTAVRPTVETLEDEFDTVSVHAITETNEVQSGENEWIERADLTAKQAEAIQAAYYHGYFCRPRESTATTIAEALGVSHSTFLQHLSRAEEKLLTDLIE